MLLANFLAQTGNFNGRENLNQVETEHPKKRSSPSGFFTPKTFPGNRPSTSIIYLPLRIKTFWA